MRPLEVAGFGRKGFVAVVGFAEEQLAVVVLAKLTADMPVAAPAELVLAGQNQLDFQVLVPLAAVAHLPAPA